MEDVHVPLVSQTVPVPHVQQLSPKVMSPILLCCSSTLEVGAGGTAVEVEPCRQQFVNVAVRHISAEEQSGKMASDMVVRAKQRFITEFLHAEKHCTR
jgi:hypothetical protein